MEIRDILKNLREKNGLTQDQLAERVMVTRQAVSRWETGETQPGTDTLKLLSKEFDVTINTLLGSPTRLVCQCCGMPLDQDDMVSREADGSFNEDYCKWCYSDGLFAYNSKDSLALLSDFRQLSNIKSGLKRRWENYLKGVEPLHKITFVSEVASKERKAFFITPMHPLVKQAASYFASNEVSHISLEYYSEELPEGKYQDVSERTGYCYRKLSAQSG